MTGTVSTINTAVPAPGAQGLSAPVRGNFAAAAADINNLYSIVQTGTGLGTNTITYAQIQKEGASTILGNPTALTANVQEIILAPSLSFIGTSLAVGTQAPNTLYGNPFGTSQSPVAIVSGASFTFSSGTFETVALTNDVVSPQNSLVGTIAANAVTNAKFRQSVGTSIVGRSAASAGNVADIIAGTADAVLVTSHDGGTVLFGAVNLSSTNAVTGSLSVSFGGLGTGNLTAHNILVGNGTGPLALIPPVASGNVLLDQGAGTNALFFAMVGDAAIVNTGTITVSRVNSVSYPAGAATTNRVALVTSAGTVTYGTVPNAALANSNIVVSGTSTSLGGTVALMGTYTALSGTVALNNAGSYFDGPSLNVGNAGTWFVTGKVFAQDGVAAQTLFLAKLWDGTTIFDSCAINQSNINNGQTLPLAGFIGSPAGNVRISVRDTSGTAGTLLFNVSGGSRDCSLSAIRIG